MTHPDPGQLAGVPLFDGLSDDQRARLAGWFEVEEFEAGHTPTRADKAGYAFYVLADGRAHAEHDGRVVEQLEPGAVFGEMAFFAPDGRRTATVVADTPIRVLSMFGTRFRELQAELPDVARRIQALFEQHRDRDQHSAGT